MDPNEKITEPQISKLKELGLTDEQIAAIPNRGKAQAKILELTRPKPTAENMAAMRARKQNIHAKTEEQKLNEQERLKAEAE
ncbi:MAG: hypothetical protein KGH64_04670, partial [Candidatus Micrarchaeota archaeon]|nr:hypothetical protein [Candidatus Micrarchaeota archaeon]